MSQSAKIQAGFVRMVDIAKSIEAAALAARGNLATLSTTDKTSLVAALNELKGLTDNFSQINDATSSTTSTYSSSKVEEKIASAISALVGGAGEEYDTLKELADIIIAQAAGSAGHVVFNASQTLDATQLQQVQDNISVYSRAQIGDVTTDYVAVINANYP